MASLAGDHARSPPEDDHRDGATLGIIVSVHDDESLLRSYAKLTAVALRRRLNVYTHTPNRSTLRNLPQKTTSNATLAIHPGTNAIRLRSWFGDTNPQTEAK